MYETNTTFIRIGSKNFSSYVSILFGESNYRTILCSDDGDNKGKKFTHKKVQFYFKCMFSIIELVASYVVSDGISIDWTHSVIYILIL